MEARLDIAWSDSVSRSIGGCLRSSGASLSVKGLLAQGLQDLPLGGRAYSLMIFKISSMRDCLLLPALRGLLSAVVVFAVLRA